MTKQNKAVEAQPDKKKPPKSEVAAVSELNPDLSHLAELPGELLNAAGDGSTKAKIQLNDPRLQTAQRQALVAHLGRARGNRHVQRAVASLKNEAQVETPTKPPLIQRQDQPGGADRQPRDAAAPAGVAQPPGPAPDLARPTFSQVAFSQQGANFDSDYTPVGPLPAVGNLNINLWVHITYNPFTRAMMRKEPYRSHRFTPDQLADFAWTKAEEEKFETDFMVSVADSWGGKHSLHLNDPDFAEYRCQVTVNVMTISDPSQAHTKITAQKVPKGAPRFRSFVSGDEATLDIRDPSEPETSEVFDRKLVRQIKPFGFDSAELTPDLGTQVDEINQQLQQIGAKETPGTKNWVVIIQGQASAKGSRTYNQELGQRRAEAVRQRITADLNWAEVNISSRGEENASEDEQFQRVNVSVRSKNRTTVTQNVAAHEAGHMFGLGDEYVDEKPGSDILPKFFGDEPSHFGDVQTQVGADAANELLVQDSGSMMSRGGTVQKGHYVYFVEALNSMTGKKWTVE